MLKKIIKIIYIILTIFLIFNILIVIYSLTDKSGSYQIIKTISFGIPSIVSILLFVIGLFVGFYNNKNKVKRIEDKRNGQLYIYIAICVFIINNVMWGIAMFRMCGDCFDNSGVNNQISPVNNTENKIDFYVSCGCGCCGGENPIEKCLYHSKGDDINKIIEEDNLSAKNKDCIMMGCSKGVNYKYCD